MGGIAGREAMCAAAGPELGHLGLFEGGSLQRKWEETVNLSTPQAGRDYMGAVRIYLEGLLKLMLRGEDAKVSSFVVGDSRNKVEQLHKTGVTPWSRSEFGNLAKVLGKNVMQIRYIEAAQ